MGVLHTEFDYLPPQKDVIFDFFDIPMKEARAYYNWYISSIDERSDYLRGVIAEQAGIPVSEMDFSAESLKVIWRWFLGIARTQKNPKYRGITAILSNSFYEAAMREPERVFSDETNWIIGDIGMYVAKAFMSRYPVLTWKMPTRPKNYIRVKAPVISGFIDDNPQYPKPFHTEFSPTSFVAGPASRIFENRQDPDDLYNSFIKWSTWIPQNDKAEGTV